MTAPLSRIWVRAIVATIASSVVFFSAVLVVTLGPVIRGWEQEVGAGVRRSYETRLERLASFTGELDRRDVEEILSPYADENHVAVVWDADRNPVFWRSGQESGTVLPPGLPASARDPQLQELRRALDGIRISGVQISIPDDGPVDSTLWNELSDRGLIHPVHRGPENEETAGYFVAGIRGHGPDSPVTQVIRAILWALAAAAAATTATASLIMLRASRSVGRALSGVMAEIAAISPDGGDGHAGGHHPGDRVDSPSVPRISEFAVVGDRIRHLGAQLEAEQKMRIQWALDIAHDFRTPVAALKAQLEGMIDGVLDTSEGRLRTLYDNLGRLESLTESFLLLTKVEAPEYRVATTTLEPASLVVDVIGELDPLLRTRERRVAVDTGDADGVSVSGDPDLIRRAVTNLLDNAVKHGEAGLIQTVVTATDETIAVEVRNRGMFTAGEEVDPFDRFSRSTGADGHGLGLALVQAVARVHGGDAWFRPDTGARTVTVGFSLSRNPRSDLQ